MVKNTLQIATFGEMNEAITLGIRSLPVHKLILLCYEDEKNKAEEFGRKISNILGLPIRYLTISRNNVMHDVLVRISEVIKMESDQYNEILLNVSAGDRLISCAALSAAFVNGIKAFGVDHNGSLMLLPVLKLSYNEVISDIKIKILKIIDNAGGSVESLEQLSNLSHLGKPLLSYHIQGNKDSKGLADLGLVEVERIERGKISVKLTTLGKLLIAGNSMTLKANV